jgi:hypothetical protein
MLQQYGDARWNKAKMKAELSMVAEWAKRRGVLVTCNEFGVHRPYAPAEARAAWTRDMRESLEELGIAWTIWDGSFGFLTSKRGEPEKSIDQPIIEALGLKMPEKK